MRGVNREARRHPAYFSGLTFKRVGPDQIDGYLALRNRADHTVREEKFTYRRVQ